MNNILYISNLCSKKKFKEIFEASIIKPEQASQKFHSLLCKGLATLNNNVYAYTTLPINRFRTKKIWFSSDKEVEGNVQYYYLPMINVPIFKHVFNLIITLFAFAKWNCKKKGDKTIILDALNLTSSISVLIVSKVFRTKSVAIITDIPKYSEYDTKKKSISEYVFYSLYKLISHFILTRFDSYIVLTEHMNRIVNPKNKPYVVIEGMVDSNMKEVPNKLDSKYENKVVIYAGALREKYGVKKLIESFMKLKINDARLWLFGSGELESDIRRFEKIDNRIKYFGTVPNTVVVEEELKATLLVNPRPSKEEFTKYSFPSKNMEYMVSGTPVLTTALPGMPNEYYDYVYIIEDESVEGWTLKLEEILNKDKEELHKKGLEAKKFVLDNKNNVVQAKKVIALIKTITT